MRKHKHCVKIICIHFGSLFLCLNIFFKLQFLLDFLELNIVPQKSKFKYSTQNTSKWKIVPESKCFPEFYFI